MMLSISQIYQKNRISGRSIKIAVKVVLIVSFLCTLALHKYFISGAYVLLSLWSFTGPKQSIKALSLSYIILSFNSGIYSYPPEIGILRWLILFIVGLRVIPLISAKAISFIVPLIHFFVMAAVLSYFSSPEFSISFLKLIAFTFCAGAILVAFNAIDEPGISELKEWFFCIFVSVVILSLPTLLIPSIGFLRNGTGFQGILNHPQALGTFLVPAAAYLASRAVLLRIADSKWIWGVIGFMLLLIFLTQARTAMAAFLLSMVLTSLIAFFKSEKGIPNFASEKAIFKIALISFLALGTVMVVPNLAEKVVKFWIKRDQQSIDQAFYASRGAGAVFHWKRFLEQPLTGHGFGIDVAHGNEKKPGTFLGIAISAPTEKGFLPTAFLEEVGILGLIFFIPFFFTIIKAAISQTDIGMTAMFFGCLAINIGEAVFFSPGGIGGFLWLLIGLSTSKINRLLHNKEARL